VPERRIEDIEIVKKKARKVKKFSYLVASPLSRDPQAIRPQFEQNGFSALF
jgi:hypothetical protein